jgi:hypothetical protein
MSDWDLFTTSYAGITEVISDYVETNPKKLSPNLFADTPDITKMMFRNDMEKLLRESTSGYVETNTKRLFPNLFREETDKKGKTETIIVEPLPNSHMHMCTEGAWGEIFSSSWESAAQTIENKQICHEVMTGAVKPYYDVEIYYPTMAERNADYGILYTLLCDLIPTAFPNVKINLAITDASGIKNDVVSTKDPTTGKIKYTPRVRYINSFHIVVNGAGYCKCGKDVPIPRADAYRGQPLFDPGVYMESGSRHNIRTIFSFKNENKIRRRPFIPKITIRMLDEDGGTKFVPARPTNCRELKNYSVDIRDYFVTHIANETVQLPELPRARKPVAEVKASGKPAGPDAKLNKATVKCYVDALKAERARETKDWMPIAMGIKHAQNVIGEDLSEILHDFSKRVPERYDFNDVQKRYDGFNDKDGGITFSSVMYFAKLDSPGLGQKTAKRLSEWCGKLTYFEDWPTLKESNPSEDDVQQWIMGCVAKVGRGDERRWYVRYHTGWELYSKEFKVLPFSISGDVSRFPVQVMNDKGILVSGEKSRLDVLNEIMDTIIFQNTCEKLAPPAFEPYFKVEPVGVFNMFKGWPYEFVEEKVSEAEIAPVLDFIDMHCGLEGPEFPEFIKKWIAEKIQFPKRKQSFIIAYGASRSGKDSLTHIISKLTPAEHLVDCTDTASITGHFNDLVEGTMMTFLNEAQDDGKSITNADAFKSCITDPKCTVRMKFKNSKRNALNYSSYWLKTNHIDSVKLKGDMYLKTKAYEANPAKVGDAVYWTHFYDVMLKDEVLFKKAFNYFAQMDITGFNSLLDTSTTKILESMKAASMDTALQHIQDMCENKRAALPMEKTGAVVYPVRTLKPGVVTLYSDFREYCRETGITIIMQEKKYIQALAKLSIPGSSFESKQYNSLPGRPRGYLLEFNDIQRRFQLHLKNDKYMLDWQETESDF